MDTTTKKKIIITLTKKIRELRDEKKNLDEYKKKINEVKSHEKRN